MEIVLHAEQNRLKGGFAQELWHTLQHWLIAKPRNDSTYTNPPMVQYTRNKTGCCYKQAISATDPLSKPSEEISTLFSEGRQIHRQLPT